MSGPYDPRFAEEGARALAAAEEERITWAEGVAREAILCTLGDKVAAEAMLRLALAEVALADAGAVLASAGQ